MKSLDLLGWSLAFLAYKQEGKTKLHLAIASAVAFYLGAREREKLETK